MVVPTATGHRTFTIDGRTYRYAQHHNLRTWATERAVEIPVAQAAMKGREPSSVLEVGNVLASYGTYDHLVVDKYERHAGVINEDIVTFDAGPFDFILSISTVEHIGWDEKPRDVNKASAAIDHIIGLRAPGGQILMTIPLGYQRVLDDAVAEGRWDCDASYLLRVGRRCWEQTTPDAAMSTTYGCPHPGATAVAFLWWR